jgi:hypothetical protein
MGKEHVVRYRDEGSKQDVNLDINNGFVYDLAGNQIAKWEPVEKNYNRLLADFASNEARQVMASSMGSAVGIGSKARQIEEQARERAKAIAMTDWDGNTIAMDLGTSDVHQAAATPGYAAGYRNEAPMADMFAPPLIRNKPSDKFYTFAKEDAFQRATPVVGATSAQVAEIAPRLANQTFNTIEYALGGFVGTQIEAAADAALRIRQATMTRVLNAQMIEREIRVAALATTASNWDTSVVATVLAAAKWDGGASSDPIADIHARAEASWGDPTGVVLSEKVFHAMQRNPQVQKYFAYKNSASPLPGSGDMSSLLNIPQIFVAKMKYINPAGVLDYIWGNDVVLFRMPAQMPPTTQDDVASAVTFRWDAGSVADGTASNGMLVREYYVQDRGTMGGNKVVLILHDAEVTTSKFVGGLIKSAWQ